MLTLANDFGTIDWVSEYPYPSLAEETGYSLPAQEKLLREYAERRGYDVTKVFAVAESASGSKQREVFGKMMDYLTKNHIPHLLCEKVDRLTRNLKEAVVVNDWIEEQPERSIHFVKQNLVIHKNAKSDEKFRWDIEIVLAKKYISNLSEEVKKGQKEKLAQGWLPCRPPLGYKTVGEKGHKVHEFDDATAPLVKMAFEKYATGSYSLMAIRDKLYEDGLRTRSGAKLAKSRLADLLHDPFYYGALRWNDVVYGHGAHKALITKDVFDKVQAVLSGKKAPHFKRRFFQFRKMLTCGECGGTITAEIKKGRYIYYHCNHFKNCAQKGVTAETQIENQLFGVFKFFESITPEEAEELKRRIKANHASEIEYKENTIRALNERYGALQRRLDNLYDDRLDERVSRDFWDRKQKEITDEQVALQEQLSRLKSEEAQYFEIWLNIIDLARRAREIYEKRTPEERRLLLSHLFSNLALKDGKVAYTYKKSTEAVAKRVQERLDAEKTLEPQKTQSPQGRKGLLGSRSRTLLRG